MTNNHQKLDPAMEQLLAALTDAAYQILLRYKLRGTFLDAQLELWSALRVVIGEEMYLAEDGDTPSRKALAPQRATRRSSATRPHLTLVMGSKR